MARHFWLPIPEASGRNGVRHAFPGARRLGTPSETAFCVTETLMAEPSEVEAEEAILALCSLPLLTNLRSRAEANGLALGAYAAAAVHRYAADASDEEWITLVGAMGRARDPGAIFLERALAYAIRQTP